MAKRLCFGARARVEASKRRDSVNGDVSMLQGKMFLHKRRVEQEREQTGSQALLRNARFSFADWHSLQKAWVSPQFGHNNILGLREAAMTSPPDLTDIERGLLGQFVAEGIDESHECPSWAAEVCRLRHAFQQCILLCDKCGGAVAPYLVLYAYKSPFFLAMVALRRASKVFDHSVEPPLPAQDLRCDNYDHNFQIVSGHFVTMADSCFLGAIKFWVLPAVVFLPGSMVASHASNVSLAQYVKGMQEVATKRDKQNAGSSTKRNTNIYPSVLAAHPWIQKLIGAKATTDPKAHTGSVVGGPQENDPPDPLTDAATDQVFQDLQHKRAEWELDTDELVDFETHVRGGAWTARQSGIVCDCIVGRACTEVARSWIKTYALQSMSSYAFRKFGETVASTLAQGWAHKMQWLMDKYKRSGDPQFRYSGDDLQGYEELPAFRDLRSAASPGSAVGVRAQQILEIAPTVPAEVGSGRRKQRS